MRTVIAEPERKRQKWAGQSAAQAAVYANRRRMDTQTAKALMRRRGEVVERSFAHLYDTGGMRRVHLRKRDNIAKRALIHAAAFNLSLILRQILRVGTARQAADLFVALYFAFLRLTQATETALATRASHAVGPSLSQEESISVVAPSNRDFIDGLLGMFAANTGGYGGSHLRKIDASGNVSSVANGYSPNTSANDGPAFYNSVGYVAGMAIDKSGNLYFSDGGRARVRMIPAPCTPAVYPFFTTNTLVHGASYLRNYVSPGQVLAIFGSGLGPQEPAVGQATSGGRYPTKLGGVQVFMDGLAARLLYVSANQINVVAPFELLPGNNASVQITYNDTLSELVQAGTSASFPGIFTASQNGQGQAAARNQDGSVNSSTNPAHPGTVVRLFFTGAGQTNPAGVDGALTGPVPPTPVLAVSARIGGQMADVVSASGLEGAVEGVLQVKLRIPAGVTGDAVAVELTVGTYTSANFATLAVR